MQVVEIKFWKMCFSLHRETAVNFLQDISVTMATRSDIVRSFALFCVSVAKIHQIYNRWVFIEYKTGLMVLVANKNIVSVFY